MSSLLHDGPDPETRAAWQRVPLPMRWIMVNLIDGIDVTTRWRSWDRATFDRDFMEITMRGSMDADGSRLHAVVSIGRVEIEEARDPEWLICEHMKSLVADHAPQWFLPIDADKREIVARRWREMQMAEIAAVALRVPPPTYAWIDDGRPR